MNPTEPSAEESLRAALEPSGQTDDSTYSERQSRLRTGIKIQTASHDLYRLVGDNVAAVLGWIAFTLFALVMPAPKKPKCKENAQDEQQ